MLLIQPLRIDEVNIDMKEDKKERQPELTPIDVIDDDVLLAILGLPCSQSSAALSSPVDESSLLDWEDMPTSPIEENQNKRKRYDSDDIFAQFDFEEASFALTPSGKKRCTISSNALL